MPDDKEPKLSAVLLAMERGFAKVDANIGLLITDVGVVKERVGLVERRQDEFEGWRKSNSDRVKNVVATSSQADLKQEANLAAEIVARQSLELKVDSLDVKQDRQIVMLGTIVKLTEKPIVKQIGTALGAAILMWLAMWVHNMQTRSEQAPSPTRPVTHQTEWWYTL